MEATATTTLTAKILFNTGAFAIASVLSYLSINSEVFFLFSLLLLIDYITGVLKARCLEQAITSNKMKYGIISKMSLIFVPIVLAIGAKALDTDFSEVLLVGINILVISEVYSVIGNIYSMRTKLELPEYDAIAIIGKKIRNFLIRMSE